MAQKSDRVMHGCPERATEYVASRCMHAWCYMQKAALFDRKYCACDIIGKASPLMRYTNMVELSDSFKQLDTVGNLRYKEKLGMLGVTTNPYSTSRDVWPAHKVFSSRHTTRAV